MNMIALAEAALAAGFTRAAPVDLQKLKLADAPEVRRLCQANACGQFGKNWTCPPGVGTVEACVAQLLRHGDGIVVQYVGDMEDSFDIEGSAAAHERFNRLLDGFAETAAANGEALLLGAGGCTVCEQCTYPDEPCRFPERARASVESYGIQVMRLCKLAGLPYHSGQNTVTFTGLIAYSLSGGGYVDL